MIYAQDIKERIGIKEGLEFYGVRFNRQGYAFCPFHDEKHPSLYVYPKDNMFVCFSCGLKGDLIQFVQAYFHIDFKAALQKINKDFGLKLDGSVRKATKKSERKLDMTIMQAERRIEAERDREYEEYCAELNMLYKAYEKVKGKNEGVENIIKAKIDDIEYILDKMIEK